MLPRSLMGWITAAVVIAGVLGLLRLGVWQLDRHQWKQGQIAEMQARHDLTPLDSAALSQGGPEVNFRRATLSGTFDAERYVLVAGQYVGGVAGYHLVQPLRIQGAPVEPLVDRGWIPREGYEARLTVLAGPATVSGLLLDSGPFDAQAPRSQDKLRWTGMAPAAMARALEVEAPGWFLTDGDRRELGPLSDSEPPITGYTLELAGRPHLEYAGTWFLLAAVLGLGGLGAAWTRGKAATG